MQLDQGIAPAWSGRAATHPLSRVVTADMTFDVDSPATIVFQISPAQTAGAVVDEQLAVWLDGEPIGEADVVDGDYGTRLHSVRSGPGLLTVSYRGEISAGQTPAPCSSFGSPELDRLEMLRPSRYCPSDHVVGFAYSEFGKYGTPAEKVAAIAAWIAARISYVSGVSDVHDSAEHTLLTGNGVCRDFAHLGIVLCRAMGVPARFVAVYAPGLDPMDFHAIFEAWYDGAWWAYDATRHAPRQTLVRMATGRDAADASFADVIAGNAMLLALTVTATSGGYLPFDDHVGQVGVS